MRPLRKIAARRLLATALVAAHPVLARISKTTEAVPDGTMFVLGYEHHTLSCLACGETEQRLVFRHAGERWQEDASIHLSDERREAPSAEPVLTVDEPQTPPLPPRAAESTARTWQRDIENIRARLNDLGRRAQLAKQEAREAEGFKLLWEGLVPRKAPEDLKEPNVGPIAPPRSRSLVVVTRSAIAPEEA